MTGTMGNILWWSPHPQKMSLKECKAQFGPFLNCRKRKMLMK